MKKNFTLYFIYCSLIIAGLSLFLVFYKNNNDVQIESLKESISNGTTNIEENIVYAKKLSLNCARTIEMKPNSCVEIVGTYLTIEPANSQVITTIATESGKHDGLKFENNKILSSGVGKYKITFSSPKSKSSFLTDTLIVNVKENITNLITQNIFSLTIGDTKDLLDIFQFDNAISNQLIQTDNKVTFSNNNTLTANAIGESSIKITYQIGMFRYSYLANIIIKEIPDYKIVITDVTSGAILIGDEIEFECEVGKSLHIMFAVLNRQEECVDQFVNIILDNNQVASFTLTEPVIIVKCLSKGSVNLRIACANDSKCNLTITINVI